MPTLARLLALVWTALTVFACSDVKQCRRGEVGCLAGPPREEGACSYGLVLINGACAEPGAAPPALSCRCPEGQVCTLDAYSCVDYCAPLELEIGTEPPPAPISCAGDQSFEMLCEHRCLLRCRQWQALCANSAGCGPDSCRSPAELSACRTDCGSDADAARCLAQRCSDTQAAGCRTVKCPDQTEPRCEQVQCRNSCPTYNFDGVCDDGDLASAASGVCPFGTDCADCGPRKGATPKPVAQGSACAFHSNCEGARPEDPAQSDSWCLQIADGISRCAPDCSSEGEICPQGSACFELAGVDQDGDGTPDPLPAGQGRASACFPVACQ